MWSWHTPTSEPALPLAAAGLAVRKGLPRVLLFTGLCCLHHLRNLGLSFVSSESLGVGAPLVLLGEVGFCLPSPLSTRQKNFWRPRHAEQAAHCQQCRKLRPVPVATVPGRTRWASAESVSAGAEGRGRNEEQGGEIRPLALLYCAAPIRFLPLPGP